MITIVLQRVQRSFSGRLFGRDFNFCYRFLRYPRSPLKAGEKMPREIPSHEQPAARVCLRYATTALLWGLVVAFASLPEIAIAQDRAGVTGSATTSMHSVKYASDYNWQQTPTSPPALVAGANTIRLAPCPSGFMVNSAPVAAAYVPTHYVYVSDAGNAEAAKITRVSGFAGEASCQFSVNLANAHGAGYTVGSASGGIKEASEAARTQTGWGFQGGQVVIDAAGSPYKIYAPLHFESSYQTIRQAGGRLECYVANDDCVIVGRRESQTATQNVVLEDVTFHAANGNTANFSRDAIHVNAQSTVIRNPKFDYSARSANGTPIGSFNSYVSVCDDEAFTLDGLDVHDGYGLRGDRRGQAVYALPEGHSRNTNNCYAVGWLQHINGNLQCSGNVVTWLSGNGLRVSDSVVQGFSQYGIRSGTPSGGYNGNTQLDNDYFEVGGCTNPDYVDAGAKGSAAQGMAGVLTQGGQVTAHGSTGLTGAMPQFTCSGKDGKTQFNYWAVAHLMESSGKNRPSAPLYLGNTSDKCSGTLTAYFPAIHPSPAGSITYDILRTTGAGASIDAPYAGGCPGESVSACGAVVVGQAAGAGAIESFTDNVENSTSSYRVQPMTFIPYLPFWPGNLVLSAARNTDPNQVPVATFVGESNLIGGTGVGIVSVNGNYSPSSFSLAGTGGAYSLLSGSAGGLGSVSVQLGGYNTATLLMRGKDGYAEAANLKGRLNFIGTNLVGFQKGSIITLVDSNPDKTVATSNYRPAMDAEDVWIGSDNAAYTSRKSMPLAFGAPSSISNYVNSLPDGTNWKERLTAKEKTLAVPLVIKEGNTLTLGSGSALSQIKIYVTNKLPGTAVPAQSCVDLAGTATGLSVADEVSGVRPPAGLGNLSLNAYPKDANTVTLHFCNPSAAAVATPAGAYSFLAVH
jgi:hypothetical protein